MLFFLTKFRVSSLVSRIRSCISVNRLNTLLVCRMMTVRRVNCRIALVMNLLLMLALMSSLKSRKKHRRPHKILILLARVFVFRKSVRLLRPDVRKCNGLRFCSYNITQKKTPPFSVMKSLFVSTGIRPRRNQALVKTFRNKLPRKLVSRTFALAFCLVKLLVRIRSRPRLILRQISTMMALLMRYRIIVMRWNRVRVVILLRRRKNILRIGLISLRNFVKLRRLLNKKRTLYKALLMLRSNVRTCRRSLRRLLQIRNASLLLKEMSYRLVLRPRKTPLNVLGRIL